MESSPKLGPEAKILLAGRADGPQPESSEEVDVLLRVRAPSSAAELRSAGVDVRTVAGDVVTGRVPVDRIPAVAALDDVDYLELSRPLHPEGEPPDA